MKLCHLIIICLLAMLVTSVSHAQVSDKVKFLTFTYQVPAQQEAFRYKLNIGKDDARATIIIDASATQGNRTSLLGKATGDWGNDLKQVLMDLNDEPLGEVWCTDFLKFVGNDVRLQSQTSTTHTYTFSPQPAETDDEDDREFLSHMQASLTIDKRNGDLLQFQMRNKRTFRPVFIAKIESFYLNAVCVQSDFGYPYAASFSTKIVGKLGFSRFEEHEFQQISDLERSAVNRD